jgi:hypothetical protein
VDDVHEFGDSTGEFDLTTAAAASVADRG